MFAAYANKSRIRKSIIILMSLISVVALFVGIANAQQNGNSNDSDEAGVRACVENYFKGHATGDASYIRKAFLPTARIESVRDGKFGSRTLDEFCGLFKGTPAADENTRTRTIDSISITGTAATAKLTLNHGKTIFTDYFVLLKVDGEWKIASKIFNMKQN